MLESDFDKIGKELSNDFKVYYRVTYNEEGVYNALKKIVDIDTWKEILNSEHINWLPKPPSYSSKNMSYFTKKGYERFYNETLPYICNYLEKENIKIDAYNEISNNVLYSDEYQVVIQVDDE